jgi:hypothetical protein
MRILVALAAATVLTFSVLAPDAHAQGRGKPQINTSASKDNKPKVDEKAYQDALKRIPEKKVDPWSAMR